jgi:hypothetical protein
MSDEFELWFTDEGRTMRAELRRVKDGEAVGHIRIARELWEAMFPSIALFQPPLDENTVSHSWNPRKT